MFCNSQHNVEGDSNLGIFLTEPPTCEPPRTSQLLRVDEYGRSSQTWGNCYGKVPHPHHFPMHPPSSILWAHAVHDSKTGCGKAGHEVDMMYSRVCCLTYNHMPTWSGLGKQARQLWTLVYHHRGFLHMSAKVPTRAECSAHISYRC
jgi:hypothetical protein